MKSRHIFAVASLLTVAGLALAAPVPVSVPVEGRGTRGEPELRDPSGAFVEQPYRLLKSCAACHLKLNRGATWFRADDTLVAGGSAADLKAVEMAIAEEVHGGRVHTVWWVQDVTPPPVVSDDRQDLRRALLILHRRGLGPFTRHTWP